MNEKKTILEQTEVYHFSDNYSSTLQLSPQLAEILDFSTTNDLRSLRILGDTWSETVVEKNMTFSLQTGHYESVNDVIVYINKQADDIQLGYTNDRVHMIRMLKFNHMEFNQKKSKAILTFSPNLLSMLGFDKSQYNIVESNKT